MHIGVPDGKRPAAGSSLQQVVALLCIILRQHASCQLLQQAWLMASIFPISIMQLALLLWPRPCARPPTPAL